MECCASALLGAAAAGNELVFALRLRCVAAPSLCYRRCWAAARSMRSSLGRCCGHSWQPPILLPSSSPLRRRAMPRWGCVCLMGLFRSACFQCMSVSLASLAAWWFACAARRGFHAPAACQAALVCLRSVCLQLHNMPSTAQHARNWASPLVRRWRRTAGGPAWGPSWSKKL